MESIRRHDRPQRCCCSESSSSSYCSSTASSSTSSSTLSSATSSTSPARERRHSYHRRCRRCQRRRLAAANSLAVELSLCGAWPGPRGGPKLPCGSCRHRVRARGDPERLYERVLDQRPAAEPQPACVEEYYCALAANIRRELSELDRREEGALARLLGGGRGADAPGWEAELARARLFRRDLLLLQRGVEWKLTNMGVC